MSSGGGRSRSSLMCVRPVSTTRRTFRARINIPLSELGGNADYLAVLPRDRDAPVLSVCQRGNASLSGLLFLKSLGYRNVREHHRRVPWRGAGRATSPIPNRWTPPRVRPESAALGVPSRKFVT